MHHPCHHQPRRHRRISAVQTFLATACLAVLAACGGIAAEPAADPDSGATATGPRPTSIVSLSPTATEMLWAIGADDQVVAVDAQSNYPKGVPTTDLSGYEPNIEAILSYEPDLVVAAQDSGDLVAGLDAAGVETVILPAARDLEQSYSQIERLGEVTDNADGAAGVVAEMRAGIAEVVEAAPDAEGATYFHELTPELYTTTSKTFIGEVYGLFGLESIADAAAGGDDYPQLSAEYVVSADPDLIFLADTDCCGVTPADVAKRPGWRGVTAVEEGRVIEVDKDIASRWGPRVVDFAEAIAAALEEDLDGGALAPAA